MRETKQEAIQRLRYGYLARACLFGFLGTDLILSQHYERWSPFVGVWMVIDGSQAILLGMSHNLLAAAIAWFGYLKRVFLLLPSWKWATYGFLSLEIAVLLMPVMLRHQPQIAMGRFCFPASPWLSLFVAWLFHEAVKYRLRRHQGPAASRSREAC